MSKTIKQKVRGQLIDAARQPAPALDSKVAA